LDDAAVERYRRDGFLFPVRVASADTAARWRHEIESVEDRWRDDATLPMPFTDFARANFHVVCAAAARLAHEPTILDAVESLIGPDIICWMTELIVKEPRSTKILTMHQDLTYWGLDGAEHLVTAWLALTDATVANGAMRFVRGSHRSGQVAHRDTFGADNLLSRGQEIAVEYDRADEVPVELDAGQMSLHHGLMYHGSGPNITDGRRVALVFRYVSPEVSQRVGATDYGMVVRGVNRTSNLMTTPVPYTDFSTASIRLHHEITVAQSAPLGAGSAGDLSYRRG
jgi:ectoine hydroxylase-related dioxygenase (phytanoyl-CoA dioxygenase family)